MVFCQVKPAIIGFRSDDLFHRGADIEPGTNDPTSSRAIVALPSGKYMSGSPFSCARRVLSSVLPARFVDQQSWRYLGQIHAGEAREAHFVAVNGRDCIDARAKPAVHFRVEKGGYFRLALHDTGDEVVVIHATKSCTLLIRRQSREVVPRFRKPANRIRARFFRHRRFGEEFSGWTDAEPGYYLLWP